MWRFLIIFISFFFLCFQEKKPPRGKPILHQKIEIPDVLIKEGAAFGGDIRMGDLTGNGEVDFLVYRSIDDAHDGGGLKPCFMGAFTSSGRVLWQMGSGGFQPSRPGPVTIFDIDHDGQEEVICFFVNPNKPSEADSLGNITIQIRDGKTGRIEKEATPPDLLSAKKQDGANWVHQRLLIANFRGKENPSDILVKLGKQLIAFDDNLNVLWTYDVLWNRYSRASAYTPAVGDLDGDGKDEVNGGLYVLDHEGIPQWERFLASNMDCALISEWDEGKMRAFCSGGGYIMSKAGDTILHIGEKLIPHGQELRVGNFIDSLPGPEMIIRYQGHKRHVMTISNTGAIVDTFLLNLSPNNTGMETIQWNGSEGQDLLYNGGQLWQGNGSRFAVLPQLPPPIGPKRMGWYHCIPADVTGDMREEAVLYNPWDRYIYVYTPSPHHPEAFRGYHPEIRQYNVRLMD